MPNSVSKTENPVRIICRANSPKLTARGKGELTYELGVNDSTNEKFVRVADNPEGGSVSFEWISIQEIEGLLANRGKDNEIFKSSIFSKLYKGKSSNNAGALAAILKHEKVIQSNPEQPTQLTELGFSGIREKVETLAKEGIDLPDFVAQRLQEREEQKKQRLAERAAAKGKAEPSQKDKKQAKAAADKKGKGKSS